MLLKITLNFLFSEERGKVLSNPNWPVAFLNQTLSGIKYVSCFIQSELPMEMRAGVIPIQKRQKKDLVCQGGQHFDLEPKIFNQNLFHQFINLLLKNTQSKKDLDNSQRKPYWWF